MPNNHLRYSIAEFFLLMTYGGLAAWCFTFHWALAVMVLGAAVGFELGRKASYHSNLLLLPAGVVTGGMFVLAIRLTQPAWSSIESVAGNLHFDPFLLVSCCCSWILALASFYWFFKTWLKLCASGEKMQTKRDELEQFLEKKRDIINRSSSAE